MIFNVLGVSAFGEETIPESIKPEEGPEIQQIERPTWFSVGTVYCNAAVGEFSALSLLRSSLWRAVL